MSAAKTLAWHRDHAKPVPKLNESDKAHIKHFVALMQAIKIEKAQSLSSGITGLQALVAACTHKTGQGYKIRALLFSLWNGKPTCLNNILDLDWELRKHLLAVMRAWGQEEFFYHDMKLAFENAGLFDWFIEAGGEGK